MDPVLLKNLFSYGGIGTLAAVSLVANFFLVRILLRMEERYSVKVETILQKQAELLAGAQHVLQALQRRLRMGDEDV